MASVQSFIRDEVNRGAFPAPMGAEAFCAYAIASGMGLIPEMENAARQTLDHPMTFEILGEGLRLFDGWALRDLANFRKRYRDQLVSCFELFLKSEESLFKFWTHGAFYTPYPGGLYDEYGRRRKSDLWSRLTPPMPNANEFLPSWLAELFLQCRNRSCKAFSRLLFNPRDIRGEYLSALQNHLNSFRCVSCSSGHSLNGERLCKELEDRLTRALNEVCTSSFFGGIAGV
jgi:hypothetical protein